MNINDRVHLNPFICKVLFDFSGTATPVAGNQVLQNFYDTAFDSAADFQEIYNSKGKVRFSEEGEQTSAGMLYTQKLVIQFPNGDLKRSERVENLTKVKHIAIGLTTSKNIILGRNDFYQNTRPKVKIETNEKTAAISFTFKSIFTCGYTALSGQNVFPFVIPNIS